MTRRRVRRSPTTQIARGRQPGMLSLSERPVHQATLANGLRVIIAPLPHLHEAVVGLAVRGGPRFENRRASGLTHFLEHCMHAGTTSYADAHALLAAVETIGRGLAATTSEDDCRLELFLPREALDRGSAILGEMVMQPSFVRAGVEAERKRVCEEQLGDDDHIDDMARALVFAGHPLGRPVMGTEEGVRRFDEDDLRTWHRHIFTARNAVLLFVGDVEPSAALRLAKRDFGSMPSGRRLGPGPAPRFHRGRPAVGFDDAEDEDDGDEEALQTELHVCFRAPWRGGSAPAALEVLTSVLGDGMASRLYGEAGFPALPISGPFRGSPVPNNPRGRPPRA